MVYANKGPILSMFERILPIGQHLNPQIQHCISFMGLNPRNVNTYLETALNPTISTFNPFDKIQLFVALYPTILTVITMSALYPDYST